MTLETLLKDYVTYNLWANELIVEWLKTKPLELMTRDVPSSFPSLQLTLLHIWSAEDGWRRRLEGEDPAQFISETFSGATADVFEGLLRNSLKFKDFINWQDAGFFDKKTSYVHYTGTHYEQFNAQIVQHCMQHSTYHRGQIVTMARHLGLTDPPKTDYIEHVRRQSAGGA